MTTIEVYADIACPWCRLGIHQFHRAAAVDAEQNVELLHRPYQLDPDASTQPRPLVGAMAEMFGREQADAISTEITRLGASEELEYRFDRAMTVNTFAAHRLLWYASREHPGLQTTLATALYDTHFRDGGNIADHTQLTDLAKWVGLDSSHVESFLASNDGVAEVREQVTAASQDGITVVPTFIFENGERLTGATSTKAILDTLRRTER